MEAAGNGVVFRVRVQRKIVGTALVASRRLCLALQNPLWKPKSIARRGRPCWLSRLSILCGDPRFSQFVLAFAKFRRFSWRRCERQHELRSEEHTSELQSLAYLV